MEPLGLYCQTRKRLHAYKDHVEVSDGQACIRHRAVEHLEYLPVTAAQSGTVAYAQSGTVAYSARAVQPRVCHMSFGITFGASPEMF